MKFHLNVGRVAALGIFAFLALALMARAGQSQGVRGVVYLPVVLRNTTMSPVQVPTSTPTLTPPPTWTLVPTFLPTRVPTRTPIPTATRSSTSENISITAIHAKGTGTAQPDEYVEIKNVDTHTINLLAWTLRDSANHVFTFPAYNIQPGQVCRVYTDENYPQWCGFSYGSHAPIWNNDHDCAYLENARAQVISSMCY